MGSIPANERQTAPAFSLPGLDGGTVSLAQYRGRRVLINFWASYCGSCRQEMPALQAFAARQKALPVVGVAVNDDPRDSREFAREARVTFPLAIDRQTEVLPDYGGSYLPMTVLVGSDGKIIATHPGPVDERSLESLASMK